GPAAARRRARGGRIPRSRIRPGGGELCAAPDGADRCLAGSRIPERCRVLSFPACARTARHRALDRPQRRSPGAPRRRTRDRQAPPHPRARGAVLARSANRGAARMKLLRTIRLDASDTFVFERAAEPGEWAVPGAFMFAHDDPDALDGKRRAAFRSGFLGVPSLGWSTLVQIVEAGVEARTALVEMLAQQLH